MSDVLLYVQHLLGIGHLRRASLLSRAMSDRGLSVTVISGGMPFDGVDFGAARRVQLPPCRTADRGFSGLVDARGRPVDAAWWQARQAALLDAFEAAAPKVVLVEMFPFGRRPFRAELTALLERAAASGCYRVSSVRDILVRKNDPAKERWMIETARRHFDRVLVHGDPRIAPLTASFPAAAAIEELLVYTGYVTAGAAAPWDGALGEVLVSAGGGAVGGALLSAALDARPLCRYAERPWRLVSGPNLPEDQFRSLVARAPFGVTVERFRADLPALMGRAAVSISQGGYNTIMDVLAAGVPAVINPFAAPGESEQGERARLLAARGVIAVVEGDPPSPAALATTIDRARPGGVGAIDLDGAVYSARRVAGWVGDDR